MKKILVAVVIVIIILSQTAFIVPAGKQALVLQFGKVVRMCKEPGLYFKMPVMQKRLLFEKRILVADASPAEYITLDKKRLTVDSVSRWRIVDVATFKEKVRTELGARKLLNDLIFGNLRQAIANHNFKEFIRAERETIMETVTADTSERAKPYGIEVVDVRIKRVDLPEEVQNSVFARMRAERERIAKRYRAEGNEQARQIRAKADKTKEIVLAEAYKKSETLRGSGDAKATAIYADAYGRDTEFYSFMRHLELYKDAFGPDSVLILNRDSDLLKYIDSSSVKQGGKPEEQ
jgi:membrane protease subunit HflC